MSEWVDEFPFTLRTDDERKFHVGPASPSLSVRRSDTDELLSVLTGSQGQKTETGDFPTFMLKNDGHIPRTITVSYTAFKDAGSTSTQAMERTFEMKTGDIKHFTFSPVERGAVPAIVATTVTSKSEE